MRTRPTRLIRLVAVALTAAGLAVPAAVGGAAPASAAPTTVTDASFTWGLNGYAQVGAQFGPWQFPHLSPEVGLLVGSVSGGNQAQYAVASQPTTSMPAGQGTPNAVRFTGGRGTTDPATGAVDLAWTGDYVVNAYPSRFGAPDEIYADPRLSIDAGGAGVLTFDVTIGAGEDINGNPSPAVDLGRITVLTFAAGSDTARGADGFRYTAQYAGVAVTESTAQNRTCTGANVWGSWPPAFVNALPDSVSPHFYSTGCGGLNNAKPPLPVDVDLGLAGQTTPAVSLDAPTRTFGQAASATVAVAGGDGAVALVSGDVVVARGMLDGGSAVIALGRPAAGDYPLQAVFYGSDSLTTGRSASTTLTIRRATSTMTARVTTVPTATRAGKAAVTVGSPTTTPTGSVRLVVKRAGRTVASGQARLQAGRATLTLPRGARGSYSVAVSYAGNGNVAASSRSVTYRVTR